MQNSQDVKNKSKLTFSALKKLLIYLWPRNKTALKARILGAMLLLTLSKAINVSVPVFYKKSIDALSNSTLNLVVVPLGLLLAYGVARVLAQSDRKSTRLNSSH